MTCDSACSEWSPFRCGVPQGSLLSPLMFNIFMKDINETVSVSSLYRLWLYSNYLLGYLIYIHISIDLMSAHLI